MTDYKPGANETRTVSSTGGEKGVKSNRLGGADPLAMEELGLVYGFGEQKYARFNYLKGYEWSKSVDALKRHLLAFERREDRDPETGLLHTAHVAWHGLALTSFQLRHQTQFDDRAPAAPVEGQLRPELTSDRLMRDPLGSWMGTQIIEFGGLTFAKVQEAIDIADMHDPHWRER